jgi:hypothetical protein
VRFVDERCRVAPEEHDRGGSCLGRRPELGAEELPVLLGVPVVLRDDDVDPERTIRQRPNPPDLGSDRVRLHAARAEDAEPAGIRHGTDELRPGASADPGRENGVVDPEESTQLRVERAHAPIILDFGARAQSSRARDTPSVAGANDAAANHPYRSAVVVEHEGKR